MASGYAPSTSPNAPVISAPNARLLAMPLPMPWNGAFARSPKEKAGGCGGATRSRLFWSSSAWSVPAWNMPSITGPP